jgi:hypothetical protein
VSHSCSLASLILTDTGWRREVQTIPYHETLLSNEKGDSTGARNTSAWISNALCQVREASLKRLHALLDSILGNILEKTKNEK